MGNTGDTIGNGKGLRDDTQEDYVQTQPSFSVQSQIEVVDLFGT